MSLIKHLIESSPDGQNGIKRKELLWHSGFVSSDTDFLYGFEQGT